MLLFSSPKLADRNTVRQIVDKCGFPGADLNFANLFLYRNKYSIEICIKNGFLYRRFSSGGLNSGLAFPIGDGDLNSALSFLRKQEKEYGNSLSFCDLTEEQRDRLESICPGEFRFVPDRDSSDYLYLRSRLVSLEGREFHRKRNAAFRFRCEFPDTRFVPLTLGNIDEALEIADQWYRARGENGQLPEDLIEERQILNEAVRLFSELKLTGGILYADGKPAAMSIASQTLPGVYDIHFEKAVPDKQLAYTLICSETARFLRDAVYINREEDMGIPGLRNAKLAWFPEKILMRYSALPVKEKEVRTNAQSVH